MLKPKFHLSNSKNKDFICNGTSILPNLVHMASLSKLPGLKKVLLEVSKKLLEKQKNGT